MADEFSVKARQRWPQLHKRLVLTYDNTKILDGAGSQLQRIYGTYSVARLIGAAYLHTPLLSVPYQGLSALEQNSTNPTFHQQFNDIFRIGSDIAPAGNFHEVELGNLSTDDLDQLTASFDAGETGGRQILLRLAVPYGIADRFPDCYEVCKPISPFPTSVDSDRALRVAIHVRRGELFVFESQRMLPNAYYVSVGQNLAEMLNQLGVAYQIEIHTEVATTEFVAQPGHGLPGHVLGTVLSPEMFRLDEFSRLPNLALRINDSAMDCLRQLATADVLVMSRSSFSYVGAILNRVGAVLYHPFWHSALSSWITVDPDGQFDRSRAVAAIGNRRGWRQAGT